MAKKLADYEIPKAVQDIDLHLAISLLILKRELEEAGAYTASVSDPDSLMGVLDCITRKQTIPDIASRFTPEVMCKCGRIAPSFLRNIQLIINLRNKYTESGRIIAYTANKPAKDPEQIELDDVIAQLRRSGITVMSSDYFWDPEMIAKLPDALKEIEDKIGQKIKLHDPLAPADRTPHREKQRFIDSQFWMSIQIVPAIVVSIEK